MEHRDVKFRFFSLRNGLLADMLRKQGVSTHKVIFGLNLPQIKEIAMEGRRPACQLAQQLWAEKDCRESRLIAPMLMEPTTEALQMLGEMQTPEEADVACHSLLRHCAGALDAALEAAKADDAMTRYAALRLLMNLVVEQALQPASASKSAVMSQAKSLLNNFPFHPLTDGVVRQLRRELEYVDDI